MKPIITEIDPLKIQQVKTALVEYMTKQCRNDVIKKGVGGLCLGCDNIPNKLVSYDVSDEEMSAKRVERYCDNCYIKIMATNGIDETVAIREENSPLGA
jgi:hypothetical protein